VHTTARHPWLTADAGWVPAGQLRTGEPVRLLDGRTATVTATRVVPGAAAMWDLTVSQVHTFAVGTGQFVVHNSENGKLPRYEGKKPEYSASPEHDPSSGHYKRSNTPVPDDAERVYKHAVPDNQDNPRHWYGKNDDGAVYQFHNNNDGRMHFSQRSDVGPPDGSPPLNIDRIPRYGRMRLGILGMGEW
jgi:hypothetical protein